MTAGRPPLLTPTQIVQAKSAWKAGMNNLDICEQFGIGISTLWQYAKEHHFGRKPRSQREYNGRRGHEPPLPESADEQPTCWVCHGRSQTWDGHDSCRGRGKAA